MRWLHIIAAAVFLFTTPAWCAHECEPPKGAYPRWLAFDQACNMYRIEKINDVYFIERLNKDYSVKSREVVDCSKAVYDPDGSYYYWPKSIVGYIWCPAYSNPEIARKLALRKKGLIQNKK